MKEVEDRRAVVEEHWVRGATTRQCGRAGVLSAIGTTPLLRLTQAVFHLPFRVFAKLEGFNPGGSSKDRAALRILGEALDRGDVTRTTTIVESSSGNMGIGLAQACRHYDLRLICVIDAKTTQQNVALLRAYGAEVDCVEQPDPVTGDYLAARLKRVRQLQSLIPDSYWPNQYANIDNARAQYDAMAEIDTALEGKVDHVFCPTSSCGTIRGCAEYVRAHKLPTRVWAVDAVGSVIFGQPAGKRLLPGHGASRTPELLRAEQVDGCIHVDDLDCVVNCRRLLEHEALLVGGSSGGVLAAIAAARDRVSDGQTCVGFFPDRGERYLDTIYSDDWVKEHFGERWRTAWTNL